VHPSKLEMYPCRDSIKINKEVEFGEVYLIDDRLVSIPDADRVTGGRTLHEKRLVRDCSKQ